MVYITNINKTKFLFKPTFGNIIIKVHIVKNNCSSQILNQS
jgi:hypothetical protein